MNTYYLKKSTFFLFYILFNIINALDCDSKQEEICGDFRNSGRISGCSIFPNGAISCSLNGDISYDCNEEDINICKQFLNKNPLIKVCSEGDIHCPHSSRCEM